MNKDDFNKFKKDYLGRFIKYYIEANAEQKKEVKRSVFDNKNLTDEQKKEFWDEVILGGKNVKGRNVRCKTTNKKESK